MEHINDILKSMEPGYDHHDVEIEALKSELIDALARVRFSYPTEICSLTPPKRIYEWTARRLVGLSYRPLNDIVVVRKVNHKRPLKKRKANC